MVRKKHILAFGILYYLITISLYSNMVKPPTGIIGERFLLAPSLGFCVVITYLIFRMLKKQAQTPNIELKQSIWIVLISLFLLIPYTAKTIIRNRDWKDHKTLLSHDIKYLENSAKANFIYAGVLRNEILTKGKNNQHTSEIMKMQNLAIKHFKDAVDVYPDYYEALNKLGFLYYTVYQDPLSAISYLKRAIKANPDYKSPYYNLAFIYKSSQNYNEAIINYQKVLEIDPGHLLSINGMVEIYHTIGDIANANYYRDVARKINSSANTN